MRRSELSQTRSTYVVVLKPLAVRYSRADRSSPSQSRNAVPVLPDRNQPSLPCSSCPSRRQRRPDVRHTDPSITHAKPHRHRPRAPRRPLRPPLRSAEDVRVAFRLCRPTWTRGGRGTDDVCASKARGRDGQLEFEVSRRASPTLWIHLWGLSASVFGRYDWNVSFGCPPGSTSYHTVFSGHHMLRVFQPNPYVSVFFRPIGSP